MAEKTSGSGEDLVFLGIAITFFGIVIAILVGVTEFPDARRFVCSQWSYLCDRNNTLRFFAVDFTSAGDLETEPPSPGGVWDPPSPPSPHPFTTSEGWDALLSLKKTDSNLPHDCVIRPISGGIDVRLAQFLSPNDVTVGRNRWTFRRVDHSVNGEVENSVKQQDNRTLIFDLFSHYEYPLKRDVTVSVNVTAKLDGLPMPEYSASYQITHLEGTEDFSVSCRLYYPGVGLNEFEFHIIDDFFHADDPIHKSVTVEAASP
jgi:hypothetical protein